MALSLPLRALLIAWLIGLVASGYAPHDRLTWVLEVAPALIAAPLLWATREKFPLSALAYWLILLHGLILMLGGAYTYARVPLGFWLQDLMGLARNPYDRIGHLAQGFVPAIIARELLLRFFRLPDGKFVAFLTLCICLAISAIYEMIEWATALIGGGGAEAFLGTQGDEFDTQADMFFCLLGAIAALALLRRLHDRSMSRLGSKLGRPGGA